MKIAQVESGYIGTGKLNDPYRSALADDYALAECVDVSGVPVGQIKLGGAKVTLEIQCKDVTMTAIGADVAFTVKTTPISEIEET